MIGVIVCVDFFMIFGIGDESLLLLEVCVLLLCFCVFIFLFIVMFFLFVLKFSVVRDVAFWSFFTSAGVGLYCIVFGVLNVVCILEIGVFREGNVMDDNFCVWSMIVLILFLFC